jgi:hypothetical protein
MSTVILESVLTCPHCGHAQQETIAHGRLPVLLRMPGLPHAAAAKAGRLLRVLLVRLGALSTNPATAKLLPIATRRYRALPRAPGEGATQRQPTRRQSRLSPPPCKGGGGVLSLAASTSRTQSERDPPPAAGAESLVMTKNFLRHDEKTRGSVG